jgi:hypothetical protein
VVKEVTWTRLIYLGRRGDVTAWRAEEENGGVVLFLSPVSDLEHLVVGLRMQGRVVGADSERHAEVRRLLVTSGLSLYLGLFKARYGPDSLTRVSGIFHLRVKESEER